jgi:sterol O-acyltransferase
MRENAKQSIELTPQQLKRNRFKDRTSILDNNSIYGPSKIISSDFHGFFNLSVIVIFFFLASHHTRHVIKQGTMASVQSFWFLFSRYDVFFYWALLLISSFYSVIIQKFFVLLKLPLNWQKLLHAWWVTTFIGFFSGVIWVHHDWPLVPKASLLAELVIVTLKVHSYLANNREFSQIKQDKCRVKFPKNVTFGNFMDFLLIPTLVYELEYPRTREIRPYYVIEKLLSTIGMVSFLHLLSDNYLVPLLIQSPNLSPIEVVMELIIPFFLVILGIFYLVFDCLCNGFAELTRFSDREFYKDWWNSSTYAEFARKWNKPVHEWLLRHIYLDSMETLKFSKRSAMFATFLFSSVIHELFIILCLRMFQPYLFAAQMFQIPLIYVGRDLKGTRFGNWFFWFSLLLGVPLLSVLYCREYYAKITDE